MTIAFLVMTLGQTVPMVTAGWCLAQLGANATLAPFIAPSPTMCPGSSGAASPPCVGIAQNIGVLGGTFLAQLFQDQLVILFVVPSIFAIGAMLLFAKILPDQHLKIRPPKMTAGDGSPRSG